MADGLLNKASIILTPTGYKAGTLYNVAPVVEPYEDFDFARASVASRVNSSGLVEMVGRTLSSELVVNGDFATDSDWTLGTGWSIGDGKASYDNSGTASLTQSFTWESGKTYEIQFEVSDFTSNYRFDLYTGSSFIQSAIVTDKTTWKIYFDGDGGTIMRFRALTTGAFSLDNVSVKEIIDTNNIPRISYDSNGDNGHILLEPTSTNLITYSEDFSQSFWNQTTADVTVTTNTNPSGTSGTYSVERVTGSQLGASFTVTPGNDYTASWYVRNISGSGAIIIKDTNNSTNNFTATSEWQRFSVTATASSATGRCYIQVSTVNDVIEVWGAQFEEGSYATSYIPTLTGSTETRATETATGAGSADLINSTEGVLYAEIAALADDNTYRVLSLSDGTTNERVYMQYTNASNTVSVVVKDGGVTQANMVYVLSDATNFSKVAIKYKANDFALWVDGVERATDTSGNTPTGLNTLAFNSGGSAVFYGKCKALAVFNEALSDSELTQLTT